MLALHRSLVRAARDANTRALTSTVLAIAVSTAASLAVMHEARADEPTKAAPDETAKPTGDSTKPKNDGDKPAKTASGDAGKDGDEVDPNLKRYPPRGVRWGLILGGSTMTLGAYFGSLAAGLGWPEVPGSTMLEIPVVGPWIALAQDKCSADVVQTDGTCGASVYVRGVLEVLSGVVQIAGLPLIGEGIFMTTEAPSKAAPTEEAPKESASLIKTLVIAPIVSPTVGGFTLRGTF